MPSEPLSERCTLLSEEGKPPKPAVRPSDCPKDAAYIKTTNAGGEFKIPGNTPFPIVFEGGEGDDKVTVKGGDQKVLVSGGKGNDSLTVEDPWAKLVDRTGPELLFGAAGLLLFLGLLAFIAWRAMTMDLRNID